MTTTNEVRNALSHLSTVEFQTSELSSGVRVALSEDEAGKFFKAVRVNGLDATSKRLGGSIVANIEAEKSGGLRDLFQ